MRGLAGPGGWKTLGNSPDFFGPLLPHLRKKAGLTCSSLAGAGGRSGFDAMWSQMPHTASSCQSLPLVSLLAQCYTSMSSCHPYACYVDHLFIIHASEEKKEYSSIICTPVHLVQMIQNYLELTLAASGLDLLSAGQTQRTEKVGDHGQSTGQRGCLNFTWSWPPPPSAPSGAVWLGE